MNKTFDLSKIPNLTILSVTMKPVTGQDVLDAAVRSVPLNGSRVDDAILGIMMRQQTVAQAIVAYTSLNGQVHHTPEGCIASIGWSQRTREFIGEIFDHMNSVTMEERASFRKALESTHGSKAGDMDTSAESAPPNK
jgi:hypothetical protein